MATTLEGPGPLFGGQNSIFSVFSNAFSSYGPAVIQGIIIVSTISGQSLINKFAFTCPCAYPLNIFHSIAFLFGPCVALFMFAVLFNQNTWKLVHGCCFRSRSVAHPFGIAVLYWLQISGQAAIAPVAWLFVAFLDGGYYKCLRAAQFCHMDTAIQCQNETLYTASYIVIEKRAMRHEICPYCVCNLDPLSSGYLQSESQVIAWLLLIVVGITALTAICCIRMCDKYTYLHNSYVQMYRAAERKIFEDVARDHACQYAMNNSKAFFGTDKHSKSDWDTISALPSLSNPYMFPRERRHKSQISTEHWEYTALQKWTNQNVMVVTNLDGGPPPHEYKENGKRD